MIDSIGSYVLFETPGKRRLWVDALAVVTITESSIPGECVLYTEGATPVVMGVADEVTARLALVRSQQGPDPRSDG